jgi:hypothetical protein
MVLERVLGACIISDRPNVDLVNLIRTSTVKEDVRRVIPKEVDARSSGKKAEKRGNRRGLLVIL